jgi:hypothetical protein
MKHTVMLGLVLVAFVLSSCSNLRTTPNAMSQLVYGSKIHEVQNVLDNAGVLLFRASLSGDHYKILAYTPKITFSTYCLMFKNDCLDSITPLGKIHFPDIRIPDKEDQDTKTLLLRDDHAQSLVTQFEHGRIDPTSYSFDTIDKCGRENIALQKSKKHAEALMWAPIAVLFSPITVPCMIIASPYLLTKLVVTQSKWHRLQEGMAVDEVYELLGKPYTSIRYDSIHQGPSTYEIIEYKNEINNRYLKIGVRHSHVEWLFYDDNRLFNEKVLL